VLYHNYCSVCHGDRGDGNSRAIGSLYPPPRNFLHVPNLDRDYMIKVVRDGKPGTAMVGWGSQLSEAEVVGVVDYIRKTFMAPVIDPRIQRGRTIYVANCQQCHGPQGEGVPIPGAGKQPRSFSTPQARVELYREKMLDAVRNGKSGTLMISYREKLKKSEIEAVVDYIDAALMMPVSQVSGTKAHGGRAQDGSDDGGDRRADMTQAMPYGLKGDAEKGRRFFAGNCAECHGAKGDGQGKRAYFINPRPANFGDAQSRMRLNRPAIFTFVSHGKLGTEMPAWNKVLSDQEIADVSEYVFQAFIEPGHKAKSAVRK
jgi:mono/diheme cytochrome c family protein